MCALKNTFPINLCNKNGELKSFPGLLLLKSASHRKRDKIEIILLFYYLFIKAHKFDLPFK